MLAMLLATTAVMGQATQGKTTNAFPAMGPMPLSIVLHDSCFGDCELTFDASDGSWKGAAYVSYPGMPGRPALPPRVIKAKFGPFDVYFDTPAADAQGVPVHYQLTGSPQTNLWTLSLRWIDAGGGIPGYGWLTTPTNASVTTSVAVNGNGTSSVLFALPAPVTTPDGRVIPPPLGSRSTPAIYPRAAGVVILSINLPSGN